MRGDEAESLESFLEAIYHEEGIQLQIRIDTAERLASLAAERDDSERELEWEKEADALRAGQEQRPPNLWD
jgi:hypothetical protein